MLVLLTLGVLLGAGAESGRSAEPAPTVGLVLVGRSGLTPEEGSAWVDRVARRLSADGLRAALEPEDSARKLAAAGISDGASCDGQLPCTKDLGSILGVPVVVAIKLGALRKSVAVALAIVSVKDGTQLGEYSFTLDRLAPTEVPALTDFVTGLQGVLTDLAARGQPAATAPPQAEAPTAEPLLAEPAKPEPQKIEVTRVEPAAKPGPSRTDAPRSEPAGPEKPAFEVTRLEPQPAAEAKQELQVVPGPRRRVPVSAWATGGAAVGAGVVAIVFTALGASARGELGQGTTADGRPLVRVPQPRAEQLARAANTDFAVGLTAAAGFAVLAGATVYLITTH